MLSSRDKIRVGNILDTTLGSGTLLKDNEHVHYCPFCNHHKKKMNINIVTGRFHCWVCDAKGKRIISLLKRLNVDSSTLKIVNDIYGDDYIYDPTDEVKIDLILPYEFKTLNRKPNTFDPYLKNVLHYLESRGVSSDDIVKYNMGYCESGRYSGRVIIPSYDLHGKLNYFIARTIFDDEEYKYKNPPASKNIVALENQINWNEPITLVEGMYDSIAVKRNAIPLFGKFISDLLMLSIFLNGVKEIRIMLDLDAQEQALRYVYYFSSQGIDVKNIVPREKDAGEMGFVEVNTIIKSTHNTSFEEIINQKLKLV